MVQKKRVAQHSPPLRRVNALGNTNDPIRTMNSGYVIHDTDPQKYDEKRHNLHRVFFAMCNRTLEKENLSGHSRDLPIPPKHAPLKRGSHLKYVGAIRREGASLVVANIEDRRRI